MEKNPLAMDRRAFIGGGALLGAAVAGLGLAGCTPAASNDVLPSTGDGAEAPAPREVDEAREVDVVIIGAGMSGLSAAMEAGDQGLDCVVLEKQAAAGGNGPLTSGIFGYNTKYQKALGIELDLGALLQKEQPVWNYRTDALTFLDMANASADNLEWLEGHGVTFTGVVDDYMPGIDGEMTNHWWGEETGATYVNAALAELERMGIALELETPAVELIKEGDAVTGVYAERADGSVLQIMAKAVVIATGGWLNNFEKMASLGITEDRYWCDCLEGHDGDGLALAVAAGAPDLSLRAAYVGNAHLSGLAFPPPTEDLTLHGAGMWVNQDGERFVNEAVGMQVPAFSSNAVLSQKDAFVVFDQTVADTIGQEKIDEVMASNDAADKWKADTLDELAAAMGVNAEQLAASVARYNELCEAGTDSDFGKKSDCLVGLVQGPFYGCRLILDLLCSIGGIHTNRSMQVIDMLHNPIEGLYAIGVDGCELYRETYTINVPATANAANIHSGRVAIRHIAGV